MGLLNLFRRDKTPAKRPPVREAVKRYYSAGNTAEVTYNWTTQAHTADTLIYRYLRILRARSREQYANNDYARRFVGMVKNHVVGAEGFQFQARTVRRNGSLDTPANDALEAGWRAWSKARHCDSTGRSSFPELMRLWVATVATDGEVFVRRRLGPQFGDYQYALQLIDPELIDPTHNENLDNGHKIRHGIELDADERPVAYWIADEPPAPWSSYQPSRRVTRVAAEEIWHGFIVERVGQKRGIPWLATPLQRMQMLDGYEEAAVIAARAGATKAMFYRQDEDADPALSGLATLKTESGELVEELEPGMSSVLPPGVYPEAYDPTYPHEQYPEFIKATLRGIASGLGVSYHKLAGDLSDVNFSSGRLGEHEDRELWKALQNWVISTFLVPLYEDWLYLQVVKLATLKINNKGGPRPLNPSQLERYHQVAFIGRRWEGIQPREEAEANTINLENRLTSPQRLLREKGIDPDDLLAEWQQWGDKLAAVGLTLTSAAAPSPGPNKTEQPDADPSEETTETAD